MQGIGKDPIFEKMYQLHIFREDEQQATFLTFGRPFASKMAIRQKQESDGCSDLGS